MIRSLRRIIRFSTQVKKYTDNYELSQQQINQILRKPKSENKTSLKTIDFNKIKKIETQDPKQLIYGLPINNQPFPVVYDQQQSRIIYQTPNQNLFNKLELNALSSYKDYQLRLKDTYNNELDMYGNNQNVPQITNLQFKELLNVNSQYLQNVRNRVSLNINIPGTVQNQDPHNFLQLRPIEQFRNTPLIPIAESAMKKHKQMLEQYHRRAFIFEISRQSIMNGIIFAVFFSICIYLIRQVLRKEQQVSVSYQRLKYKRIMGEDDKTIL